MANDTKAAYAISLGCVAMTALLAWAAGAGAASMFTLFLVAVAVSAWIGGRGPAAIALLASILAIDVLFHRTDAIVVGPWTIFAASSLAIALLIDHERDRAQRLAADLDATQGRLGALRMAERDARRLNLANDRLASLAGGAAAFVVSGTGVVTGWTGAASRMYGRTDMTGMGAHLLFGSSDPADLARLLSEAEIRNRARWAGIHRRADGAAFDVEVDVQPTDRTDAFTFAVHDLTREREWDAFRAAAGLSDASLREEAELMRRQLAALESVTDPALDVSSRADIEQLLDRLRVAIDADGVAFLLPIGIRNRLILANGLQPATSMPRTPAESRRATNRVQLIQNDPSRVAQSSVLEWPESVSCLIGVPIVSGGVVRGVLEVVNERPRRATDADMALIRVVANRVAMFDGSAYSGANAVA